MTKTMPNKAPKVDFIPKDTLELSRQDKKLVTPDAHYEKPDDVVKDLTLSKDEKVKALDNWELTGRQLDVAADEGMGGGEPSRTQEVGKAKKQIDAKAIEKPGR
jgi:hypothetical protein